MSTKQATISAILGSLCFSIWLGSAGADEIKDDSGGTLYGWIAGFEGNGIVFHQNCAENGQTFSWDYITEARFSDDCSAAKSWRGGGDPPCESEDGTSLWIDRPGLVSLEVMPQLTDGQTVLPFGTATELLSRGPDSVSYRDVCSGDVKTIPTGDLVLVPSNGYCPTECQ